jgi:hypothetical protein
MRVGTVRSESLLYFLFKKTMDCSRSGKERRPERPYTGVPLRITSPVFAPFIESAMLRTWQ